MHEIRPSLASNESDLFTEEAVPYTSYRKSARKFFARSLLTVRYVRPSSSTGYLYASRPSGWSLRGLSCVLFSPGTLTYRSKGSLCKLAFSVARRCARRPREELPPRNLRCAAKIFSVDAQWPSLGVGARLVVHRGVLVRVSRHSLRKFDLHKGHEKSSLVPLYELAIKLIVLVSAPAVIGPLWESRPIATGAWYVGNTLLYGSYSRAVVGFEAHK